MTDLERLCFAVLGIMVMAIVTFLMRAGGFWMMARIPLTVRVRRGLEALPGTIVASIVLPMVVAVGQPALLALAAAIVVMIVRKNELLAIVAGMTVAAMARIGGI